MVLWFDGSMVYIELSIENGRKIKIQNDRTIKR
jgi:hypothetical protein